MLGNSLLYLFLAGNGAQSLVSEMLAYGPSLFFYALITVGIHGLVIFGIGRLLKFDAGTLVVASQANIGGRRLGGGDRYGAGLRGQAASTGLWWRSAATRSGTTSGSGWEPSRGRSSGDEEPAETAGLQAGTVRGRRRKPGVARTAVTVTRCKGTSLRPGG